MQVSGTRRRESGTAPAAPAPSGRGTRAWTAPPAMAPELLGMGRLGCWAWAPELPGHWPDRSKAKGMGAWSGLGVAPCRAVAGWSHAIDVRVLDHGPIYDIVGEANPRPVSRANGRHQKGHDRNVGFDY
jgi:hypothetical protein